MKMRYKILGILGAMIIAPYLAGFVSQGLQIFVLGVDTGIVITFVGGAIYIYKKLTQIAQLFNMHLLPEVEEDEKAEETTSK